jgi:TrkA domain protein
MSTVTQTTLPGVGIRYDFETKLGDRIGVIAHHAGHYDFLLYDRLDPDTCSNVLPLDADDAHTLTDLLGGSQVAESQQQMQQSIPGLIIDWIPVQEGWLCQGESIREIGVRARTGASIVAVVRGDETIPSPDPDFRMQAGDTAVVVGTQDAIRKAFELLQGE